MVPFWLYMYIRLWRLDGYFLVFARFIKLTWTSREEIWRHKFNMLKGISSQKQVRERAANSPRFVLFSLHVIKQKMKKKKKGKKKSKSQYIN